MSKVTRTRKPAPSAVMQRKARAVRRADDRALDFLRLAIDASDDGVLVCDADDRLVFVNRAFTRAAGIEPAPGTRFEDLIRNMLGRQLARVRLESGPLPGDAQLLERQIGNRIAMHRQGNQETELRTLDGRWIHVRDQRTPDGLTLTRVADMTARRQAEEAAHIANQRLRNGLEHLGELITLSDADDRIVLANRRFLEFNAAVAEYCAPGCHYGDHLRAGIRLGLFPDADGREEAWFAERIAMRRRPKGPVERRRQDGRWLMVDDQVLPDGGVVTFGVEITARKLAEHALRAGEQRFRGLVNLSHDSFWETDAQHRFIQQSMSENSAFPRGMRTEIGKTRWEIPYVAPDQAAWARHRAQIDAREVFRDFELARPAADGGVRHIQVSGEPVFDASGAFTGYRGVSKDITGRKRGEEALHRLNAELERRVSERTAALEAAYRELESFSYAVSHDLRAPLRSISGFATLLREDEGDQLSAEGQRYLQVIDQSAQRMGRLIDALLDLARTSRQQLHREPVDMHRLAQQTVSELAAEYPNARITVAALPAALGDAMLLHQVWSNLVSNALKYSSHSAAPEVELGVMQQSDETVYFVRDNGAGFEMEYVSKLFHPFGRLHAEKDFPGTGVGLVVAKMIVERHGGRVWPHSRPGQGATFYFTLAQPAAGSA